MSIPSTDPNIVKLVALVGELDQLVAAIAGETPAPLPPPPVTPPSPPPVVPPPPPTDGGITSCAARAESGDPTPDITMPGGDAPAGATGLPVPALGTPALGPGGDTKWLSGFDDSRFATHNNWTHGDPNKYLPAQNGYYYLNITATGPTLIGTVQVLKTDVQPDGSGGSTPPDPNTEGIGYRLDFSPDLDHTNRLRTFFGCTNEHGYAELRWTGAIVGQHYRFRLANRYDAGLTDHATFRSE